MRQKKSFASFSLGSKELLFDLMINVLKIDCKDQKIGWEIPITFLHSSHYGLDYDQTSKRNQIHLRTIKPGLIKSSSYN